MSKVKSGGVFSWLAGGQMARRGRALRAAAGGTWQVGVPGGAAGCEHLEPRQLLAVVTWDGGGDGANWTNPANWDGDVLPGTADDVVIPAAPGGGGGGGGPGGAGQVVIGGGVAVRSITAARPISTSSSLTLSEVSVFSGGLTMNGSGTLGGSGDVRLGGTSAFSIWVSIDGAGRFEVLSGGSVEVLSTTFNRNVVVNGGGTAAFGQQFWWGGSGTFGGASIGVESGGTLRWSPGNTNYTQAQVAVTNSGTIVLRSGTHPALRVENLVGGTLQLESSTTIGTLRSEGTVVGMSSSTLTLNGPGASSLAGGRISGLGGLAVQGVGPSGTEVAMSGPFGFPVSVSSAQMMLQGVTTLPQLQMSNANMDGPGDLTVTGSASLSGTLSGTGRLVVPRGGSGSMSGGTLDRELVVGGWVSLTSLAITKGLTTLSGASFNASSVTFGDASGQPVPVMLAGQGSLTNVTVAETAVVTVVGSASLGSQTDLRGSLSVAPGGSLFASNVELRVVGQFDVQPGGTFQGFQLTVQGAANLAGNVSASIIAGAGDIVIEDGGQVSMTNLSGPGSLTVAAGGRLTVNGQVQRAMSITGELSLLNAQLLAPVTVLVGGVATLGSVAGDTSSTPDGRVVVRSGGAVRNDQSAGTPDRVPLVVDPGGTADLTSGWNNSTISNAGLLVLRSGGIANTAYSGRGELRVLAGTISGTLTLDGGRLTVPAEGSLQTFTANVTSSPGQAGSIEVLGTWNAWAVTVAASVSTEIRGVLRQSGSSTTFNGPTTFAPASITRLEGNGQLQFSGPASVSMRGEVVFAGGELVRLAPVTLDGVMRWQGGRISGTAPLTFGLAARIEGQVSNSMTISGLATVLGTLRLVAQPSWPFGSVSLGGVLTVAAGGSLVTDNMSLGGGEVRVESGASASLGGWANSMLLTVNAGGTLQAPSSLNGSGLTLINNGTVSVASLFGAVTRVENRGQMAVSSWWDSVGSVENTGSLSVPTAASVAYATFTNGAGATANFTVSGRLSLGNTLNSGSLGITQVSNAEVVTSDLTNNAQMNLAINNWWSSSVTNAAGATLVLVGNSGSLGTVTNAGTFTHTGSFMSATSITNSAGAVLTAAMSTSTFSNAGTATVSGFAGSVTNLTGGTLTLGSTSVSSLVNNGTLVVNGAVNGVSSGTLSASGTVEIGPEGSFGFAGTLNGPVTVRGGAFDHRSTTPLGALVTVRDGGRLTLTAPGQWPTPNGLFRFGPTGRVEMSSGTITAPQLELLPASTLALSGSGPKTLIGDISVLTSNFTWSGGDLARAGRTDIAPGGRWTVSGGGIMTIDTAGAASGVSPTTITVLGTLSTGPAGARIAAPLSNAGLVDLAEGPLSLLAGGSHSSDVVAAAGSAASLTLDGTHMFSFGSDLVGGVPLAVAGGIASFAADQRVPRLTVTGGSLAGNGTIVVDQSLTWSAGSMSGRGRTVLESTAVADISGPATKTLSRVLEVQGAAQAGPGPITLQQGVLRIAPAGELLLSGQVNLSGPAGGAGRIDNAGRIRVLPGASVTVSPNVGLGGESSPAGVLSAGQWVIDNASLSLGREITEISANAAVTLRGPSASFVSLGGLGLVAGRLDLESDASLAVSGSVTVIGTLSLSARSVLSVGGGFTQTAAGVIRSIAESDAVYGRIVTSGGATVGGRAEVTATGVQPFTRWALVRSLSGSVAGRFVSVSGPAGELLISKPYASADDLGVVFTSVADIVGIGGDAGADGLITGDDFNAFVGAFSARSLLADIVGIGGVSGGDGLVSGDDFVASINAFAAR